MYSPDLTTIQWLVDVYPKIKNNPESQQPLECVCLPGDILYIPTAWWHSTLNVGETVFLSAFVNE